MTELTTYAQERINFYEARFKTETNNQLANDFSELATTRGWTSERSYYSHALVCEMERRGVNLDAVICQENGTVAIRYIPVVYDESLHALVPAR